MKNLIIIFLIAFIAFHNKDYIGKAIKDATSIIDKSEQYVTDSSRNNNDKNEDSRKNYSGEAIRVIEDSSVQTKTKEKTKEKVDTSEQYVVNFLRNNKRLPSFYITKNTAIKKGWVSREGNLCMIAPNTAIGGDNFTNRERKLPQKQGRRYFEADINYNCGFRGKSRIVYSNDGLIYVTYDHYKSFKQVN